MKKAIIIGLAGLVLTQLVGCTNNETISIPERPTEVTQTNGEENIVEQIDKGRILDAKDFLPFFRKYFTFTEEEMLLLNQMPEEGSEAYRNLREKYMEKIMTALGDYLSDEAKAELGRAYLNKVIEVPKKLEINEYVTYGSATVEGVEVLSMRDSGENRIYEVAVTTENDVKDAIIASQEYAWDNTCMYYVKKENAKEPIEAFTTLKTDFDALLKSYVFAEDRANDKWDRIRLVQRYWVEVVPGDELKIASIQSAIPLNFDQTTKQKASNVDYVERLPYTDEVSDQDRNIVQEVVMDLLTRPKQFYVYLEGVYKSGFSAYQKAIENELETSKYWDMKADTYTETFNKNINPYKDQTLSFKINKNNILLTSSKSSTKKQPRYQVLFPVQTLEADGKAKYYEYEYFVGFENEKIEVLQFVRRSEQTKEWYERP